MPFHTSQDDQEIDEWTDLMVLFTLVLTQVVVCLACVVILSSLVDLYNVPYAVLFIHIGKRIFQTKIQLKKLT